MWNFARSLLNFSWAMSAFGIRQAANLFTPGKAAKAFDDASRALNGGNALPGNPADLNHDDSSQQIRRQSRSEIGPVANTQRDNAQTSSIPVQSSAPSSSGQQTGAGSPNTGGGWGPMPVQSSLPSAQPSTQPVAQPSVQPVAQPSAQPGAQAGVQPGARSSAGQEISPDYPYPSKYLDVFGSRMHYIEQGTGNPILLLHGNPTWSYIWRNIIPHLSPLGRCIAPDLIGYGRSAKPDIEYRWFDHVEYLDKFIEKMGLRNIILVLHDHGSGLGFHYAMRHQHNIRAIAFFEAIVRPYPWDKFSSPEFRELFRQFRSGGVGGQGWQMLVEQNVFIEQLLPQAAGRPLTEREMNFYREPFRTRESRVPIWRLAGETPIGGEPQDVWNAVKSYSERLQKSDLPKLMLYFTPGALLTEEHVNWCKQNIKNLKSVYIGPGLHFVQEGSPHQIGQEIAAWCRTLPSSPRR